MVSGRKFSALQYWTDQILVCGVDSNVEEYFLGKPGWTAQKLNKLVYACKYWRSMVEAKEYKDKKAFYERFAGALTVLSEAEMDNVVMPNRLSILSDGDMADYLSEARKGDREDMGAQCFNTTEFCNFKYEVKNIEVNRADIKDCQYQVKYICPKGVIISFESQNLYLIERAVKKEQRERSFFPAIPANSEDSKSLKARRKKIKEKLPWGLILIGSVARAVRFDSEHDAYVSKDKVVYVELQMAHETEDECREVGGPGTLAITAQSNLKQYVPKDRWEIFQKVITKKCSEFEKRNKDLLSPDSRTNKTKELRKAYGDLVSYFGNPKNPVAISSPLRSTPSYDGRRSDKDKSDRDGDVDMSGEKEDEIEEL